MKGIYWDNIYVYTYVCVCVCVRFAFDPFWKLLEFGKDSLTMTIGGKQAAFQ